MSKEKESSGKVSEAAAALANAIKKNGQCIMDMHTIQVRRSTGNEEYAEWEKSCDELALAHAKLSMAIADGAIEQMLGAVKDKLEVAIGKP